MNLDPKDLPRPGKFKAVMLNPHDHPAVCSEQKNSRDEARIAGETACDQEPALFSGYIVIDYMGEAC